MSVPNVTIENDIPDGIPVPNLDKEQFRQILVNLVQNAAEAVRGDGTGKVAVGAEGGGDRAWRITISDNGGGIPADVLPKIFEPLFTTKTKGTGLGLAVVSGIVQKHKGTISVQSEPGKGTRFLVELPAMESSKAA